MFEDAVREALAVEPARWTTWGEVTGTAPLMVRLAGDTDAIRVGLVLASYTPVVGDKTVLIRVGAQWVCAGKLVEA